MFRILLFSTIFICIVKFSHGKRVRWCTCEELDRCQEEMGLFQNCMEECKATTPVDFDADAVLFCMQIERKNPQNCWSNFRKMMCASRPGMFMDDAQSFHLRGKNGSRSERDPSNPSGGGSVFSKFSDIEAGDETHVQEFMKCVRMCELHNTDQICYKRMNCNLKKPPRNIFEAQLHKCHEEKDTQRKRMCDCLVAANVPELCNKLEEQYGGVAGFLG